MKTSHKADKQWLPEFYVRYFLLCFITGLIYYSGCQTNYGWVTNGTCVLKNSTGHKIGLTFHRSGGSPTETFVSEKNSETTVERVALASGAIYDSPQYLHLDSISVLYDDKVLIRHYRNAVKSAAKSYNKDSNRSLFKKDSYLRTTTKNPKANDDKVHDVQLLYTFTEEDYLFAK